MVSDASNNRRCSAQPTSAVIRQVEWQAQALVVGTEVVDGAYLSPIRTSWSPNIGNHQNIVENLNKRNISTSWNAESAIAPGHDFVVYMPYPTEQKGRGL